jgi:hypothetical protein
VGRFSPLRSSGTLSDEIDRRRKEVSKKYGQQKRQLYRQRLAADRKLKQEISRTKRETDRYYRLHKLRADDPRRERAEHKAERKFGPKEEKLWREHERKWDEKLRSLQRDRERRKRQESEQMRKRYRDSLILGGGDFLRDQDIFGGPGGPPVSPGI